MTRKDYEFIIASVGAFVTVIAAGFFSDLILLNNSGTPIIIASTGASAMVVLGLPDSPVSRPWNLVGGHTFSAIVGVSCYQFIPNELLAASLSIPFSMIAMYFGRCMHPPGGATAITAVIGGVAINELGYMFVITPIFFNSLILLTVALGVATFRKKNPFI
ncbi:MAG: HPP family protein [Nitrosomonadales bacterium]|jgi:CBS domain-containing membrane protein|nr:HPP family protein [Nitrosomonadales bacterium]MBT3918185.1 HPP family protein [Nitrosomonadales bacterium]MBT4182869.1 HPP family protein [Nitrosomonadales bacterium]MBT4571428.1 HPP family protein [Nitrosomonadales bacterium]MBT4759715.1 HPP family protein [Nitrosomonadales bacterium]